MAELRALVIVLGDQLDRQSSAFDDFDVAQDAVWMTEVVKESTHVPSRLRVNVVAPGLTDTPSTAGMLRLDAMRLGAGRQYPLVGVQTAAQIAWLSSSGASRITGQVIAVDGGFTVVRPLVK